MTDQYDQHLRRVKGEAILVQYSAWKYTEKSRLGVDLSRPRHPDVKHYSKTEGDEKNLHSTLLHDSEYRFREPQSDMLSMSYRMATRTISIIQNILLNCLPCNTTYNHTKEANKSAVNKSAVMSPEPNKNLQRKILRSKWATRNVGNFRHRPRLTLSLFPIEKLSHAAAQQRTAQWLPGQVPMAGALPK